MSDIKPELCRPVPVGDILHNTLRMNVTATEEECAALAHRFGDIVISYLRGEFNLMLPMKSAGEPIEKIDVNGEIDARVIQQCVVTSDPVETTIHASFSGIVAISEPDLITETSDDDNDEEHTNDEPEFLGIITDDTVDLGHILSEQLALELDPFPRKPEASFEGFQSGNSDDSANERPNPFAVLAKLKDNPE